MHIYFLIGLRSRFFVATSWAWSYLTDQRGARLILQRRRPAREEQRPGDAQGERAPYKSAGGS